MTEGAPISVQIEEKSASALSDLGWQQEQRFKSSEPVFIQGLISGEPKGSLAGHLIIDREVSGDGFQEKTRYIRLSRVDVQPHERKKGLGSLMVSELEKISRRLGASKIIGEISAADLEEQPWLADFYEKLGFALTKKGEGYLLEKKL